MRLGIGSYAYTWAIDVPGYPPACPMDAFALLLKVSELGVGLVQFADNLPLDRLSYSERARLRQMALERGIGIEEGVRVYEAAGIPVQTAVCPGGHTHPSRRRRCHA